MEQIGQLKADGIAKGLCRQWQMKLHDGISMEELARLFIRGIDFCISKDFPTLDFLRTHYKGRCEPFGVLVDDDVSSANNVAEMVLNGASRAMLDYDGYSVSRLWIRHSSEAAVIVSGNAILNIDIFDNSTLHISVVGDDANVTVNTYGGNTRIEYIGDGSKDKVKTIINDKTTY